VLLEGDQALANPYSFIAVAPQRRPGGNHKGALRLIAWFTSAHGRDVISGFQVNGQALFTPAPAPAVGP
jgi:tungstate transport system substrate-binding protein